MANASHERMGCYTPDPSRVTPERPRGDIHDCTPGGRNGCRAAWRKVAASAVEGARDTDTNAFDVIQRTHAMTRTGSRTVDITPLLATLAPSVVGATPGAPGGDVVVAHAAHAPQSINAPHPDDTAADASAPTPDVVAATVLAAQDRAARKGDKRA